MKLEDIRREYLMGGLRRENLQDNPYEQFSLWLKQAITTEIPDPTAMTLATVDDQGQPSQRIVLLKHLDSSGFIFYTNYKSNKALQIAKNPKVCLHFPWHGMERQVKVEGVAEKITKADSLKYFLSRPRDSQLAAWASQQSHKISSRKFLLMQYESMKAKFANGEVPIPDFWGGFLVRPHLFEFWQGGGSRLHDRFQYIKEGTHWQISRLAP